MSALNFHRKPAKKRASSLIWIHLCLGGVLACARGEAADPNAAPSVAPSSPSIRANPSGISFRKAKPHLRRIYSSSTHQTLYAGCSFTDWKLSWAQCCLTKPESKQPPLQWEHVMPASLFGQKIDAWKNGHPKCVNRRGKKFRGRRCANRVSAKYRRMAGDMHNLMPALGVLNQARGNLAMGMVPDEHRRYGSCDFELAKGKVEPRPPVRGEIARAYLYMNRAYPELKLIDDTSMQMFTRWHRADPPDDWERARNRQIEKIQGNANPLIK